MSDNEEASRQSQNGISVITFFPVSLHQRVCLRKLVYAFYNPVFSFREVIKKHPEAAGLITDCLSGDLNKDFSQLWNWFKEFVPLPDDLPYGDAGVRRKRSIFANASGQLEGVRERYHAGILGRGISNLEAIIQDAVRGRNSTLLQFSRD